MKKRTTVKTNEQLQNCINSKVNIEVWFAGEMDCVSKIKSFNDEVVVFEKGKYLQGNATLPFYKNGNRF